jgi:hypothetical protein
MRPPRGIAHGRLARYQNPVSYALLRDQVGSLLTLHAPVL